ncbi:MAG: valine--tRNA ligase [Terriglobales bacterium]
MFRELPKTYDPQAIEPRWARAWVEQRLFHAANGRANNWSLVIPPPNVTGSLHMGHMLEHTLIDIVVRWRRMLGDNVLWLPGTDHAGIATQMVVERARAAQGQSRQAMGRAAFEEAVWAWKEESGNRIQAQMMRLGASCDWQRERFTLDADLSRAVREVFVRLYEEGLIYRGRYIVNWCPRCQTAVSDLEVVHAETVGKLYRVRYPVAGSPGEFLEIATTRPETILADVAVAVNPADARYQHLLGRQVQVPLTGRTVPVIVDEIAQPEFGTGAVKITPGHDPNDFAAGERHKLPQLTVLDESGHMTADAGAYASLDRFAARKRIVADLEAAGLLAGVQDHPMAIGQCQRCQTVIEPRISTQWFVRIAPLAQAAVAAAERGEVTFVPTVHAKHYFDWMAGIHDWCISRQLWWGHRIPAWYCDTCGQMIVAREPPAACSCGAPLRQDLDVLDTWFSSGLWPFSTLGWPDTTDDLRDFYPTSLLVTGFDILFFWVARMLMLGVHFTGQVPFRQVYIHALVRDAERQKMSKTKGNVIDPLLVTEKYGTDAVRFTLASMAAPGTDIALAEERMQGYAAFANKIWNAARFIFSAAQRAAVPEGFARLVPRGAHWVDRWIFSRLNAIAAELERNLSEYRFHEAAATLYHFFWHEFCDWYLEITKLRLRADEGQEEAAANLLVAFDGALRLLHPFMPFLTEELWTALHEPALPAPSIALAPFPQCDPAARDDAAVQQAQRLQALVTELRRLQAEAGQRSGGVLRWQGEAGDLDWDYVAALARLTRIEHDPAATLPYQIPGLAFTLDLAQAADPAESARRRQQQREQLERQIAQKRALLANPNFLAKANPAVVARERDQLTELEAALASVSGS